MAIVSGDGTGEPLERPLGALEVVVGVLFLALLVVHLRRPKRQEERAAVFAHDRVLVAGVLGVLGTFFLLRGLLDTLA